MKAPDGEGDGVGAERLLTRLIEESITAPAINRDVLRALIELCDELLPKFELDGPSRPPETEDRPPATVPGRELLRWIGGGGFGQTWLARNTLTDHHTAIKFIAREREELELGGIREFQRKVNSHRHIMPILNIERLDGGWIVCESPLADDASGRPGAAWDADRYTPMTLDRYAQRFGPLDTHEVAQIGMVLAGALSHMHACGVAHGDMKPDNVLRVENEWKIADYSLLVDIERDVPSGRALGFTPPEGGGATAADQYSLGVTLLKLLCGRHVEANPEGLSPPPHFKRPQRRVLRVIRRMLAPTPEERYPSLREAASALHQAAGRTGMSWRIVAAAAVIVIVATAAVVMDPASRFTMTGPQTGAAPSVLEFQLSRHLNNPGAASEPPGQIGLEVYEAQLGDEVRLALTLSKPGYAYLLALNADGSVRCYRPGSADQPPRLDERIVFPEGAEEYYRLTAEDVGAKGFLVVTSARPLPAWSSWSLVNPPPAWRPDGEPVDGVWRFDGASLSQAAAPPPKGRGEIVRRETAPAAVRDLYEYCRALDQGLTAAFVVFPVNPAQAASNDS